MSEELQWLIGALFGVVALVGGVITRDRQMSAQIRRVEDKLHERINKVKDDYVKKTDMDEQVRLLRDDIGRMRDEIHEDRAETNKRLDTIISSVTTSYSQAAIERSRS